MSDHYDQKNDEFLSFSPSIVPWHQITSFIIIQAFNSTHLHCVMSQMTNIRKLELHYQDENDLEMGWERENFVKVVDDTSLCNMLMSNGLRQLNLFTINDNGKSNWRNIANLIIERLYHLKIIELHGMEDQLIQMAHILINVLSELNFLTFVGNLEEAKINEKKIHDLQNSNTRSFRTEIPNTTDYDRVFIWL